MATETPVVDTATERERPQYPVGLRVLRLWAYPLSRAHLITDQSSAFLFPLAASIVLLTTIYIIGVVVAWHDLVLAQFITNPLVPALLIATGWSAVWISWAGSVYQKWGLGADAADSDSPEAATLRLSGDLPQRLREHWSRLCNLRLAGGYAVLAIVAVIVYLYISVYGPANWLTAAPASIRAIYAFPNQSYWMFVYLAAVAAILADVGSFGLFFTAEHLRFISEFVSAEKAVVETGASNTVKMLYLARKPLQELAYASFLSSMAWFGAVTIFVGVFVVALNVVTFLVVAVFIVLGLYVFLRPQWDFHELISHAKGGGAGQARGHVAKGLVRQGDPRPETGGGSDPPSGPERRRDQRLARRREAGPGPDRRRALSVSRRDLRGALGNTRWIVDSVITDVRTSHGLSRPSYPAKGRQAALIRAPSSASP
jgi:hypothetical protein